LPRLVYLAAARRDLVSIFEYIARESGSAVIGRQFATELRRRCAQLAALPGTLGRSRPELHAEVRSVAHKGYVIFFRYRAQSFEVVNIIEGHRDIGRYFADNPSGQ